MHNNQPIGIFDSGIGGTSIWRAIHQLLPYEKTIYLADSKNAPYGQKSKEEIVALSMKNTDFLLKMNCKLIVVACNTATTNAIQELRAKYDVPFIGIEPAIKPAANNSLTQTIGILATKGTLNSELFNKTAEMYQDTKIIEKNIATGKNFLLHQFLHPFSGLLHLKFINLIVFSFYGKSIVDNPYTFISLHSSYIS